MVSLIMEIITMKAKKNPVAKAIRTPQFRMQVVKSKKLYFRKNKGQY